MLNRFAASAVAFAAAAAGVLYLAAPVRTSDHQDTLQLVDRPGADITDMYVFPAKDPKNVVMALDVHPLIPAGLGHTTYFDPGVMYQIKIDTVGDYREHRVLQFHAEGTGAAQKIVMYGPSSARPGLTATFGTPLGSTPFAQSAALPGNVQLYAGPRREPFFFDLTQFFKIDPDRNYKNQPQPPPPSATCLRPKGEAENFFTSFNVLSLIVELPRATLTTRANHGRINLWATASLADPQSAGTYTQVERWGRPAVKEALEPFKLHAVSNRREPYDDPVLRRAIYRTMTAAKPNGAGRSPAIGNALAHLLGTDEMQVNLAATGPATYLGVETKGKSGLPVGIVRAVPDVGLKGLKASLRNGARQFGGRDADSPVIDLSLGAIYGSIVPKVGLAKDDRRETPCLTSDNVTPTAQRLDGFPYLGEPV